MIAPVPGGLRSYRRLSGTTQERHLRSMVVVNDRRDIERLLVETIEVFNRHNLEDRRPVSDVAEDS